HILPEVEATCGRVVILDAGRVVGEGDPSELRSRTSAGALRFVGRGTKDAFEAALARFAEVGELTLEPMGELVRGRLVVDGDDAAEKVFRAVADAGLTLRELSAEATSLEDVFASLTTEDGSDDDEDSGEASDADEGEAA
nr:hypothetical protein [Myxococcota bacterium]